MIPTALMAALILSIIPGQTSDTQPTGTPLTAGEILADMGWLEGAWRGDFEGSPFEARYSSPRGQAILSLSKEFFGERPAFIEFEKFQIVDERLVLTPYPGGEKSDSFPLLRYEPIQKMAVFENKEHDFPTRISYHAPFPETLIIVVSGVIDDQPRELVARLAKVSHERPETIKTQDAATLEEGVMNDEAKFTPMECHKKFAVDIFNQIWTLLEKPGRSDDENEKLLQMAYASAYHWREAGTAINQARGEWMISRVNAILGRGEAAWHHASRSLAICRENGFGDFDLAYAYEAQARAAASKGDKAGFEENYRLAEKAGAAIKEKADQDLFKSDLASEPWFGLK